MPKSFADFNPEDSRAQWDDAVVRRFEVRDSSPCVAMMADRHGWPVQRAQQAVERWVSGPRSIVLVAERRNVLHGYGKAEWLEPASEGGDAPDGWYLTGVVVAPGARRHGLGSRLTAERIQHLQSETRTIRYCMNQRNQASIALHEKLGFRLETVNFSLPGLTFDGGRGCLYRLDL